MRTRSWPPNWLHIVCAQAVRTLQAQRGALTSEVESSRKWVSYDWAFTPAKNRDIVYGFGQLTVESELLEFLESLPMTW